MEIEKKKGRAFLLRQRVSEKERLRKRDFSIHVCLRSYVQTIHLPIELASLMASWQAKYITLKVLLGKRRRGERERGVNCNHRVLRYVEW